MAMTSIYYTECGHWGRRNLSGSSRSRERYDVRIRSYKKVGNKIWYTGWSKAKNIRTK